MTDFRTKQNTKIYLIIGCVVCTVAVVSFVIILILLLVSTTKPSPAVITEETKNFEALCLTYQSGDKEAINQLFISTEMFSILADCQTLTDVRKVTIDENEKYLLVTIINKDGTYSPINSISYHKEDTVWKFDSCAIADPFNN
ncbi:MAG: hypothetical protein WCP97_02880 [bacterium]